MISDLPTICFTVTLFKVAIPKADITVWTDSDAVNLRFKEFTFDTNDRASLEYAFMSSLSIMDVEVSLLQKIQGYSDAQDTFHRLASVVFNFSLDSYKAPDAWQQQAVEQQKFLRQQDTDTGRVEPMYAEHPAQEETYHVGPLYLPRPFEHHEDDDPWSDSQFDDSDIHADSSSVSDIENPR
jgi:hypothetical protein